MAEKENAQSQPQKEAQAESVNAQITDAVESEAEQHHAFTDKTEPLTAQAGGQAAQKRGKKGSGFVAYLALLLSLISLGALGGAYWFWQKMQLQQQTQQQTEQQQLQTQLQNQQAAALQTLETRLKEQLSGEQGAALNQINALNTQLTEQVSQRLNAVDAKVLEVSGRQPSDWVLAEAQYLIRIAGRKLWLEHDKDTAKELLSTAMAQVATLSDSSLLPLQGAIAKDIAVINALPDARVTDYYLSLSGLIGTIDHMKVNVVEQLMPVEQNNDAAQAAGEGWADNLIGSVTSVLKRMFHFDYDVADTALKHRFTAQEQWYLRANLRLAMLQAQNAVLQRNTKVFSDSLQQAVLLLAQFNQADSNVQAALGALQVLLNEPVDVQYPEQFAAERLLGALIKQRMGDVAPVLPAAEQGAQQ